MSELTHQKRLSRFRRSISEANKIALMFQYFWNMIFDNNPLYCFGCGEYIPIHKRTEDYFKRPYKKEPIHSSCWALLPQDDFVKRLNEESLLICHLELGWGVHGSVCRSRVRNNPLSIMVHMIKHHHYNKIPELPLKEIKEEMIPNDTESLDAWKKLYLKKVTEKPTEWFIDNQWIYESIRNIHFLKPNGRSFPKVKDY